jgi:hypothetical protein
VPLSMATPVSALWPARRPSEMKRMVRWSG